MAVAHLFEGGPPRKLEKLIGLSRKEDASDGNRIFFLILIGWIPLLDLALVQSALGDDGVGAFIYDYGVHARMLIAVPLLVWANGVCAARLSTISNKFISTGMIREDERERFAAIRSSVGALRETPAVEVVIALLAYGLMILIAWFVPPHEQPSWHASTSEYLYGRSIAGWWHLLVSVPVLLILILSWFWRIFLWTLFLAKTSRLHLRLIAAHPDGAGGLGFVGYSVQAFSMVALAFSVIVAGTLANQIVHNGASLHELWYTIGTVVAVLTLLFCAPLCAFSWRLLQTWRMGVFTYGGLAREAGERFEAKWFSAERPSGSDVLDAPDFSAVTDLYSIVANVYRMRMVPVALGSVIALAASAAAPFFPVALLTMPLDQILKGIAGVLM